MRIKGAIAIAVAALGLGSLASTAAASASNMPMPQGTLKCAGHTMSGPAARHSVIVRLIVEKPHSDVGLGIRYYYKGNNYRKVGFAHADCWTAIPLKAGKVLPNLCLEVTHPYKTVPSTDGRPPACPAGRVIRYMGVRWVTYTFRVTY